MFTPSNFMYAVIIPQEMLRLKLSIDFNSVFTVKISDKFRHAKAGVDFLPDSVFGYCHPYFINKLTLASLLFIM